LVSVIKELIPFSKTAEENPPALVPDNSFILFVLPTAS